MNKKIIGLMMSMAIFSTGLLSGCIICVPDSCSMGSVAGSGAVVSQTRSVPEFDRIHLKGIGRVLVTQDNRTLLTIRTDDNIQPLIKTTVSGNTLTISNESIKLIPTTLEFHVLVPVLKGVSISGSGDILGEGRLETDIFAAAINGSGDMTITITASRMTAEISGSGSMDLTGEVNEFRASVRGSGDILAQNLRARHASVSIAGSGDCHLSVSDSLRAEISGSGDIIYAGQPRIENYVRGSGSVKGTN